LFNQALITERLAIISKAVKRLKLLAEMPLEQFKQNEDV
jgi:hypothetical protein